MGCHSNLYWPSYSFDYDLYCWCACSFTCLYSTMSYLLIGMSYHFCWYSDSGSNYTADPTLVAADGASFYSSTGGALDLEHFISIWSGLFVSSKRIVSLDFTLPRVLLTEYYRANVVVCTTDRIF
nr:hypothetical protein [Crucivirus sp.]